MTREEAFQEINETQDTYIEQLTQLMEAPEFDMIKALSFTSPTGTGKTKMMSKLINMLPQYFFLVTTLSKGQLQKQIQKALEEDCAGNNYVVYGSADYKINSKLEADDILSKIPENAKCVWLRDEGHIRTTRFEELLENRCYRVINFSATNVHSDITCNFAHTMMLRTVHQVNGGPYDAIKQLMKVKKAHAGIPGYNPCALVRCVSHAEDSKKVYDDVIRACKQYNLKYIDITDNDFIMAELCKDDNEYDVIINKMKIVEGVDIRRAHVLFMDNQPANNATTIQVIGRCRRNALLYRNDIDILAPENKELLKETRQCYVFYNVNNMRIAEDENGELQYAFCDTVSCEALKTGSKIEVTNGQMANGLSVLELQGETGEFTIVKDPNTGFNVVEPRTSFYNSTEKENNYIYVKSLDKKIRYNDIKKLPRPCALYSSYTSASNGGKNVKNMAAVIPSERFEDCKAVVPKCEQEMLETRMANYEKDDLGRRIHQKNYWWLLDNTKLPELSVICKENDKLSKQLPENAVSDFFQDRKFKVQTKGYDIKDVCSEFELALFSRLVMNRILSKMPEEEIQKEIEFFLQMRTYCGNLMYHYEEDISTIFHIESKMEGLKTVEKIRSECEKFSQIGWGIYPYIADAINSIPCADTVLPEAKLLQTKFSNGVMEHIRYGCLYYAVGEHGIDKIREMLLKVWKNYFTDCVVHDDDRPLDLITYILLFNNVRKITNFEIKDEFDKPFAIHKDAADGIEITESDFEPIFEAVDSVLNRIENTNDGLFWNQYDIVTKIYNYMKPVRNALSGKELKHIDIDCSKLFVPVTEEERSTLPDSQVFPEPIFSNFSKKYNDEESAIVGTDLMGQMKTDEGDVEWVEMKSVGFKVQSYNKLNSFITQKYAEELEQAKALCFGGTTHYDFEPKCARLLSGAVEYYAKYLMDFIDIRERRSAKATIVRDCLAKYRSALESNYGGTAGASIRIPTEERFEEEGYRKFVNTVVKLGEKTKKFVVSQLYNQMLFIRQEVDPRLSIQHISGVADFITEDTILNIKTNGYIDATDVRQALGYHYLSTKRSDLHIRRVIIYDAYTDKGVTVNISEKNQT